MKNQKKRSEKNEQRSLQRIAGSDENLTSVQSCNFGMVKEMFTPTEAEVNNAMPRGPVTAKDMAKILKRDEGETEEILEAMAEKGLSLSLNIDGIQFYQSARFMVGIFEYQFMSGRTTERDKKIAKLIHAYEKAYNACG